MKKYITPKMECAAFVNGGILCHSQDGKDQMNAPKVKTGSEAPTVF